jgi:hypothetical protein
MDPDTHHLRGLKLTSVSNAQNLHLIGLSDAVAEVDRRFNADPLVQAVLRSDPSGSLISAILVTTQYPQQLMTYTVSRKPRVPHVDVYLREEPFRGLTETGMVQYVMRAFAAAIVLHGMRRKVDDRSLTDWFASIPGHDRFEPSA